MNTDGKKELKVALVHDYLKEIGGAERVLFALKEIFPQAHIYTAYKFPSYWGEFREKMSGWKIYESWGRWLPFLPKFISYYTIFSPWFFSRFDLSGYDLVIVSATGGYFPNAVKIGERTRLFAYCHTPPRFLYGYETASRDRYKWYWRPVSALANLILRQVDFRLAQRPHLFIANSKNVAERIWKFYRREAVVVYPPIEKSEILNPKIKINPKSKSPNHKQEDYYLVVSRIIGSKNIELAIKLADTYPVAVKIVGRAIGSGGRRLVDLIRRSKLKYLGEVSEEKKRELMVGAKALLCLEKDADFGMTPIEAQMLGTPVAAYRGGGYLESVEEDKTGVFFDELTHESLYRGLVRLDKLIEQKSINAQNCRAKAKGFGREVFVRDIRRLTEV